MSPGIIILLGRCVWTRDADGWRRESFDGGPAGAAAAQARMSEILSADPPRRWTLVFEPEGIAHQTVETPRVSRTVFASLARVRSEFPVVESESLGWGIEFPEPTQGGAFSTLMHAELTPGLAHLQDACVRAGSRLNAAWPAYTAAVACAHSAIPPAKAKYLLILARDFVAVATCAVGKRAFKAWVGPMSERDWKAFSILLGDAETRSSASMADPGQRRGAIAVIAEGEPNSLCPLWAELHSSGRVGTVMSLDALAAGAARIPRNHPANLAEAFPMLRDLDKYLLGAASAALLAALGLGVFVIGERRLLKSESAAYGQQASSLESRLETLTRNQAEINRLQSEIPADPGFMQISRHEALVGLASAIPDALTLTSLAVRRDNAFEIEAIVVGAGVDPDSLRRAFERSGFEPDPRNGWDFNAAAGRLAVRGKLGAPRT